MENREPEVWKPVPGYENLYEVSSWGNVRSLDKIGKGKSGVARVFHGKLLSTRCFGDYICVVLCNGVAKNRTPVHLIVLSVFHRSKNEFEKGNHIDLNKLNNYYKNLEWLSVRENTSHYYSTIEKSSVYIGVTFEKDMYRKKKWGAKIYVKGKNIRLGRFFTEEEAHLAYVSALEKHGLKNKYVMKNQEKS